MPVVTRLTAKHQTTIPAEVRRALGLKAGDHVAFSVEGRAVRLSKAEPPLPDTVAFRLMQAHTMRDWDTPEDDEAFREL
jgi:antitoxin PrlF